MTRALALACAVLALAPATSSAVTRDIAQERAAARVQQEVDMLKPIMGTGTAGYDVQACTRAGRGARCRFTMRFYRPGPDAACGGTAVVGRRYRVRLDYGCVG